MPGLRIPPITNNPSKIQLSRPGHIYFEHPDLTVFSQFASDFGFIEAGRDDSTNTIYYRGYGKDPYVYVATKSKDGLPHFRGPAFVAQSQEEFNKAARLPGAQIEDLSKAPGGGKRITFTRADDTWFHVIYGQEERKDESREPPTATHENQGPFNLPYSKPRKGHFQRFHEGPALVHKLGHFGYIHTHFDAELAWYTSNFNFVPSDILYDPSVDDTDVLIFMHLDLGAAFSDHHCFFMSRAPPAVDKTYIHHSSYEVDDFDTQNMGHQWLVKAGYKSVWGVGRHILGSQIFDYFSDTSGFKIEHYCDGDVVNQEHQMTRDVVGPLAVWGPEMNKDFFVNEIKKEFPEMPLEELAEKLEKQ